jgi:hypothetical protein
LSDRTLLAGQAALIEKRRRAAARQDILKFASYVGPDYRPAVVHRRIADGLMAVMRGEIDRLLIEMPPRFGKSRLCSVCCPAFFLGHFPHRQIICTSYGAELATTFGRDVRNLIGSQNYRNLFPGTKLAADSQARGHWNTEQNGVYVATGVGGAMTGMGADLLIIDDPVKDRAEAESEQIRQSTWDWYRSVAYTRLQKGGAVVVIGTRWHEDDLIGQLLLAEENGGDRWHKLVFPAVDEQGVALWPEEFPREALDRIRAVTLEYDWEALYMQRPRAPGGNYFSLADLLVDDQPVPAPTRCDYVFAIVDSAAKTGKENDATAVGYFARNIHAGIPLTILDWDITQIEGAMLETWLPAVFTELEGHAKECGAMMGSAGAWIEDKSTGMVLLQQAAAHGWSAQAIDSKLTAMGKVERGIDVSGYVHQGMAKFSRQAYERTKTYKGRTRNHLLSQLLNFRIGIKDMDEADLFDVFTYGLALSLGNTEGF